VQKINYGQLRNLFKASRETNFTFDALLERIRHLDECKEFLLVVSSSNGLPDQSGLQSNTSYASIMPANEELKAEQDSDELLGADDESQSMINRAQIEASNTQGRHDIPPNASCPRIAMDQSDLDEQEHTEYYTCPNQADPSEEPSRDKDPSNSVKKIATQEPAPVAGIPAPEPKQPGRSVPKGPNLVIARKKYEEIADNCIETNPDCAHKDGPKYTLKRKRVKKNDDEVS
jgi:hypothetical protein